MRKHRNIVICVMSVSTIFFYIISQMVGFSKKSENKTILNHSKKNSTKHYINVF